VRLATDADAVANTVVVDPKAARGEAVSRVG